MALFVYIVLAFLAVVSISALLLAIYSSIRYSKVVVGPVGPQGPKGDTGDEGPRGGTGATGPAGPTTALTPIDFFSDSIIPTPRQYFELTLNKSKVFNQAFKSCDSCAGIPRENTRYDLDYYYVTTIMYYPPSVTTWTQFVEAVRLNSIRPYQYYYLTDPGSENTYLKLRTGVYNNGDVVWKTGNWSTIH